MIDMFDMIETSSFLYWEIQPPCRFSFPIFGYCVRVGSTRPITCMYITFAVKLSVRRNVAQKFLAWSISQIRADCLSPCISLILLSHLSVCGGSRGIS